MNLRSQISWFSIVLALGLTLLLSITGLYILEYIIPFSQNIKGVENASSSYYEAYSGIEQALYIQSNAITGYSAATSYSGAWQEFRYTIIWDGRYSPRQWVWEWSSEYDTNYNKISQSEPAQFLIWSGRLLPAPRILQLALKVPDIDPGSVDALDVTTNDPIILWQVSSTTASLTAGAPITESQINAAFAGDLLSPTMTGTLLDGTTEDFQGFYDTFCLWSNECVLKISVINPLVSTLVWAPKIPYLEYRIDARPSIPLRAAVISTQWKSYGFSKEFKVLIPQTTTNSAFDFTVFQ
jgi:hypothetical protein